MRLPLGVLVLSVGTRGLGVLLSGSTQNSMRRQRSGGGERGGWRVRENIKAVKLVTFKQAVCGWGVRGESGSVGQCHGSARACQGEEGVCVSAAGAPAADAPQSSSSSVVWMLSWFWLLGLLGPEADRSLSHSTEPRTRTKVTPSTLNLRNLSPVLRTHLAV